MKMKRENITDNEMKSLFLISKKIILRDLIKKDYDIINDFENLLKIF